MVRDHQTSQSSWKCGTALDRLHQSPQMTIGGGDGIPVLAPDSPMLWLISSGEPDVNEESIRIPVAAPPCRVHDLDCPLPATPIVSVQNDLLVHSVADEGAAASPPIPGEASPPPRRCSARGHRFDASEKVGILSYWLDVKSLVRTPCFSGQTPVRMLDQHGPLTVGRAVRPCAESPGSGEGVEVRGRDLLEERRAAPRPSPPGVPSAWLRPPESPRRDSRALHRDPTRWNQHNRHSKEGRREMVPEPACAHSLIETIQRCRRRWGFDRLFSTIGCRTRCRRAFQSIQETLDRRLEPGCLILRGFLRVVGDSVPNLPEVGDEAFLLHANGPVDSKRRQEFRWLVGWGHGAGGQSLPKSRFESHPRRQYAG